MAKQLALGQKLATSRGGTSDSLPFQAASSVSTPARGGAVSRDLLISKQGKSVRKCVWRKRRGLDTWTKTSSCSSSIKTTQLHPVHTFHTKAPALVARTIAFGSRFILRMNKMSRRFSSGVTSYHTSFAAVRLFKEVGGPQQMRRSFKVSKVNLYFLPRV